MTPSSDAIAAAGEGTAGRVVVLSANPMHDTGGGQRSAMLARAFLARGWAVVFVSHGRVTETVDLGLRFDDPHLVELQLRDALRAPVRDALADFLVGPPSLVITQVPIREWLPVLRVAADAGATTVYDCVDRWDSELGRGWYRREAEEAVARASDVNCASAPALLDHVERLTGREAFLLPNAFDARVFDPDGSGQARPDDLPEGRVALYVGALWGGWMDWGLVRACAEAAPGTAFVFIGDRRREGRGLPANCRFLGLKPQVALPPYLAGADLAFLPWKADAVTHATSPLKVYEFTAMGLPVVAPALDPLRGIPGVLACPTHSSFVRAIGQHDRAHLRAEDAARMRAFSKWNSWDARVDRLLEVVGEGPAGAELSKAGLPGVWHGDVAAPAIHVGARLSVVIPSFNHERWVGAAVASAEAQTLAPAEVVVVDDGSTDGSRDVLTRLERRGVRVVFQENRGAHHALNRAITLARGEWVAILNSDDLYDPERLEHAWSVARATRAALVCGAVRMISESGTDADPGHDIVRWYDEARACARSTASMGAALARHNVAVTTSNFFMHRELWRRVGGFRPWRYVHDWDFLLRGAALCPRDLVYEDALGGVRYRVHGANTISENLERARAERAEMLSALRRPKSRARLLLSRPGASRGVRRAVRDGGTLAPEGLTPAARVADESGDAGRRSGDPAGMHVGIVVTSLGTGGLEETVALLAQALPAIGVRVSVLCTERGGAVADRLRTANVDVRVESGGAAAWTSWARGRGVDLVSTHFAPGEVVDALVSAGLPVVETVQNSYAWFTESDWRRERDKAKQLAGVVAVSDLVAAYYLRHAGRGADAIVPNAVHPGRVAVGPRSFARARLGVAPDTPLFVSVARLTEQKNPAGLVRAFARARERVPDARLLLFGPLEKSGGLSGLRAAHPDLFGSGAVRHVGVVPDVGTILGAADVFVSNSFYEGWSVAASEALWAGVPVVLSETGGARELVGAAGERGILVPNPCGDPLRVDAGSVSSPPPDAREANERALAEALARMALDLDAWRARSKDIRSFARAELGPGPFARRWAGALRTILERASAG